MWLKWLIIGIWIMDALVTVAYIGRKREPITVSQALLQVCICALLVWGTLLNWK